MGIYTQLILLAVVVIAFVGVGLIGFFAYWDRGEHPAIRVTGFIIMAVCALLAITTLLFIAGSARVAWPDGDERVFQRKYEAE